MNFKEWLQTITLNESVKEISYAEAMQKNMFGPVYHGTTEENRQSIKNKGFNISIGLARQDNVANGYTSERYGDTPYPPPIHHLGYGVYFTTNKTIAKMYNHGTTKGLQEYFLNVPRIETINFGSPRKMMDWWRKNGYNMDQSMDEHKRMEATINMTNTLKEKYDAVYFKGKSMYRLLDGDQICVFDPQNIYIVNPNLSQEDEFAPKDRFVIKNTDIIAKVMSVSKNGDIYVSYDDPDQKLLNIYGNEFMNDQLSKMDSQFIQRLIQNSGSNSKEEAVDKYLNYHFPPKQRYARWPKKWIGKTKKAKGYSMQSFKQFLEARKMSKSNNEKWQRIECEDCERIYYIPKAKYDFEVKTRGKWRQMPIEDCPYCRYEYKMDDIGPGDLPQNRPFYMDDSNYD